LFETLSSRVDKKKEATAPGTPSESETEPGKEEK